MEPPKGALNPVEPPKGALNPIEPLKDKGALNPIETPKGALNPIEPPKGAPKPRARNHRQPLASPFRSRAPPWSNHVGVEPQRAFRGLRCGSCGFSYGLPALVDKLLSFFVGASLGVAFGHGCQSFSREGAQGFGFYD